MLNPTNAAQANNSNTHTHQPIGFVRILAGTFSLYRKHFRLFLVIIALRFCGELMEYMLGRFLPDFFQKEIVVDLVDMLFTLVSMGGTIVVVATIYLGGHITGSNALKQSLRRFWHILACFLVWSLAFDISRTSISGTMFSVMNPITLWMPDSPVTSVPDPLIPLPFVIALIRLVSVPFSIYLQTPWWHITSDLLFFPLRSESLWMQLIPLAFVPFSIYFAVRWTFSTAAVLFERSAIRSAFERSSELTRDRWWQVWGMLISFSVLCFAMLLVAEISMGCILTLMKLAGSATPIDVIRLMVMYEPINVDPLFLTMTVWTNYVVRTLVFPIWVIGITLLYVDLRIRKDGFKVEIPVNNTSN